MQIGALIVAAGMSSRMGEFKPMLSIGSISVAQRVVATLSQSGVSKIVMVTGYNATVLERHLSGNGIIFLRNEAYETTQMFDSVKIGLSYLMDKCDRILFTPVDVPLFTAKTVKTILDSGAPLAVPMCEGKQGHPILIANELIPEGFTGSGIGRGNRAKARRFRVGDDGNGMNGFSVLFDTHHHGDRTAKAGGRNLYHEAILAGIDLIDRAGGIGKGNLRKAHRTGQDFFHGLLHFFCLVGLDQRIRHSIDPRQSRGDQSA